MSYFCPFFDRCQHNILIFKIFLNLSKVCPCDIQIPECSFWFYCNLFCLAACDCKTAPYCISKALIAAVEGDWENGLFFCGANAGEVNTLSTVKEQMDQILNEWRTAP